MEGPSGVAGAKDAKYIYIKVVGEEPAAAAVLALKRDPLGMLTKKVADDTNKISKVHFGDELRIVSDDW